MFGRGDSTVRNSTVRKWIFAFPLGTALLLACAVTGHALSTDVRLEIFNQTPDVHLVVIETPHDGTHRVTVEAGRREQITVPLTAWLLSKTTHTVKLRAYRYGNPDLVTCGMTLELTNWVIVWWRTEYENWKVSDAYPLGRCELLGFSKDLFVSLGIPVDPLL